MNTEVWIVESLCGQRFLEVVPLDSSRKDVGKIVKRRWDLLTAHAFKTGFTQQEILPENDCHGGTT
jgi:hypothetical protein